MRLIMLYLFFGAVLFAVMPLSAQFGDSPFITRTYTAQDGLPHSYVHQVVQDRNGYLWINTRYGISRFDGSTFADIDLGDFVNDHPLGGLFGGPEGSVFILSGSGRYGLSNQTREKFHSEALYFPLIDAGTNSPSAELGLWRFVPEGISALDKREVRAIPLPRGIETQICRKVIQTDSGYYFNFLNDLVFVSRQGKAESVAGLFPPSRFLVAMGSWDGEIYVYNTRGVFALRAGRVRTLFPGQWKRDHVYVAARDGLGRFWVATHHSGILVSGPREERVFRHRIDLTHPLVSGFYEDKEGNIWIAGFEGLTRVWHRNYAVYSSNVHPCLADLNMMAVDAGGEIVLFSETHGISRHRQGKWVHDAGNPFRGHLVDAICQDDGGRIWGVTRRQELIMFDPARPGTLNFPLGRPAGVSGTIVFDPCTRKVWTATDQLLVGRGEGFEVFRSTDGQAIAPVRQLGLLGQGRILVSTWTDELLLVLPDDKIMRLTTPARVRPGEIYRIFPDTGDTCWVSYPGQGLLHCRIVGDSTLQVIQRFSRDDGLMNDFVQSLARDREGRIWVSTMAGVVIFDFTVEAAGRPAIYQIGREEGMPASGMEYGRLAMDSRGNMWFSTQNVLMRFDVPAMTFDRRPPLATIESVFLNNQRTDWSRLADSLVGPFRLPQDPVLPYRQNTLTVVFRAATLAPALGPHFSYYLAGHDRAWSHASTANEITFANLRPGAYTFLVRASDNGLSWSAPAIFAFTIRKPFWQTVWFRAILAILAAGFAVMAYRMRIGQLMKERTIRDQIARDLHDDLGGTLNSVKIYANVALLERENAGHIGMIRDNVQLAITALRDIIWVLDEGKDTVEELTDRLLHFEGPLCHANGIRLTAEVQPEIRKWRLGSKEKRNIFLVLKEALNNSIKHAGCTAIDLRASAAGRGIFFEVADNGRGMEPAAVSGGYGLGNMQRRAEEIRYALTIESAPDAGTRVRLEKNERRDFFRG